MKFDSATIAVVSVINQFFLLLILLHTWRTRTTYPGFSYWIAGTACWLVGGILGLLLPDFLPRFISKIIALSLFLLMPVLLSEGLRRFHRLPIRWKDLYFNLVLVAATVAMQSYYVYVEENVTIRAIWGNLALALLFSRIAFQPLFNPISRRHSMQWLLSLVIIPLIALFVARAWWYASFYPVSYGFTPMFQADILLRWLLLHTIIAQLVINYSYLSLTSDRVEEELHRSESSLRDLSESLQQRVDEEIGHRLAQERIMARQARLAAMGEMIGAIAHQWRQPLSVVSAHIQNIRAAHEAGRIDDNFVNKTVDAATRQCEYMSATIEEFLGFLKPVKPRELFDVREKLDETVQLVSHQLNAQGITLTITGGTNPPVSLNSSPGELKQVLLNLIANAGDAIVARRSLAGARGAADGAITVTIEADKKDVVIHVCDNGCGIPEALQDKIFVPYFTTKEERGGTGIGLYHCKMIVESSMGGTINVTGRNGLTCFTLRFSGEF